MGQTPSTPPEPDLGRLASLAFLRTAASVLFGIFLVSVILRAFPLRLMDPAWQVAFVRVLVEMGGYALLGVVVITVAQLLEPDDRRLLGLQLRVSRLARLAALGYLLLIPLLGWALYRDYTRTEYRSERQRQQIGEGEVRLRQAITSAGSRGELVRVIQAFNAPAVPGFLVSDAPLELQRRQALQMLEAMGRSVRSQAAPINPASVQAILLNNLRLLLLSLLFAIGFASADSGGPGLMLPAPLRRLLPPGPWRRP